MDDYVNSIPADYFDYGKGMSLLVEDLMLGDQPVDVGGNNQTSNVIVGDEEDTKKKFTEDDKAIENLDDFLNISLPSDRDAKLNITPDTGDSEAENLDYLLNETAISIGDSAKSLNNAPDDYVETNNTNSLLPVINNGTDVDNVHDLDLFPATVVPNKTELQEDDVVIIIGEQNTTNIHSASGLNIGTDDDVGSGSGDSAIIIGTDDDVTGIQEDVTTRRQEGDSSTTTVGTEPSHPTTMLPTLPPVVGVSETSEPRKVTVHTEPPSPTRKLPTLPPVVGVSEKPEPTKVTIHTEPLSPTRKLPTLPPVVGVSEIPEPTKVIGDRKGHTGNINFLNDKTRHIVKHKF